jgi:hypothetical protein
MDGWLMSDVSIVRCKECKHWDATEADKPMDTPSDWHTCKRVRATFLMGENDLMALYEGFDDGSDLYTASEFFCAHGEAG